MLRDIGQRQVCSLVFRLFTVAPSHAYCAFCPREDSWRGTVGAGPTVPWAAAKLTKKVGCPRAGRGASAVHR